MKLLALIREKSSVIRSCASAPIEKVAKRENEARALPRKRRPLQEATVGIRRSSVGNQLWWRLQRCTLLLRFGTRETTF